MQPRWLLPWLLVVLTSCSTSGAPVGAGPNIALVDRLKNRGPVTISTENPFLAGNLLISKEVERSEELRGFVKHRGAPAAIEVTKDFFEPLAVQFYYPETRQQYSLELAEGTWIISGPLTIEREKMKEVQALLRGQVSQQRPDVSDVAAASTGQPAGTSPKTSPGSSEQDPFLVKLEGATSASSFHSPATGVTEPPAETPLVPTIQPSIQPTRQSAAQPTEAQTIMALAKKYGGQNAEISPQGDLVHYVTYSSESLPMIARWYTFDRTNAEKLARINALKNPHVLNIGDMVVIPSYILKNKTRLSEKAVQELGSK